MHCVLPEPLPLIGTKPLAHDVLVQTTLKSHAAARPDNDLALHFFDAADPTATLPFIFSPLHRRAPFVVHVFSAAAR